MASVVFSLRADSLERERWQRCADAAGVSFTRWARLALNEQADLVEALGRLEVREAAVRSGRVSVDIGGGV